ncbi:electron transfer flavoprotein beta subunit lysine methyltransferase [Melanotaenia boesemani]|uniref:electron transfer flavoprotein beta subunit lysine methyltransferase n=1 Tax=Melanotaenia boesemani TaxID=1250792 RepID=UPI001C05D896|nr:electron transfer flavoprotein beta subunit lysine methyltransferase [Melanotaenia boesemani]XP_041852122.1 electron transfer flavoprotein beta subunit lysine methyltransferase [Melanotaenia boesemani]
MSGLFSTRTCSRCVKRFFKLHTVTDRRISKACHSDEHIRSFIRENTQITGQQSLTPEIKLRLFTPDCRFWRERPELWPFDDPYWAIYWPGGQAVSRYLLDNPEVCRGRAVLDLGSGCGASAIAAKLSGAAHVVANDIDTVASVAIHMNSELNGVKPPACVTDNMIGSEPESFDLILLGDMFYDESLATSLHSWLDRCIKIHGTRVLIGDPGRAQFEGHSIRRLLQHLAQFELPQCVKEENYGLTCSSVWLYHPNL